MTNDAVSQHHHLNNSRCDDCVNYGMEMGKSMAQQSKSYLDKLYATMGPLYKFQASPIPLHHNTQGLSKSIDFETGLVLKNFVEYYKPSVVCELGTFRGYSTAWLLAGARSVIESGHPCDVHAFEVFKEGYYGSMWYHELDAPFKLINFTYHEIPGGIWKYEEQIPETIDLLYHDTQHLPEPTRKELTLLLPRISKGGIVLIDDMLYPGYEPMAEVVDSFFVHNDAWDYQVVAFGHGLGIARKK